MLRNRLVLSAATALVALGTLVDAAEPAGAGETAAQRDQRMAWWREARFGMFIHWGLYAIPAGEWKGKPVGGIGEWIMNSAKIPVAEYEPLQKRFNPVKFDAKRWARIAKQAGMKYVVLTSKHHDGFCLFDSKLTDYDVMGSPFGRDICKELAEACQAEGLTMCWYHSIMDWHHPDYLPRRAWDPRPGHQPDFKRYQDYLRGQLRELTTNYGKIGVLWFDGEWEDTWTHDHGKALYGYVRGLDPAIVVNNRVDKGRQGMQGQTAKGDFAGDFGTPEQEIPPTGLPGVDWESCMTMNDTWGFKKDDRNWKSTETLVRNLIDIASKGGNYLLNVGPTAEGEIPAASVERLAAVGKWMETNGESIVGTSASPFKRLAWGRATRKSGKLYLHVFDWPKGELVVPGLENKVTKAYLLADKGRSLETTAKDGGVAVTLPAAAPDAIASVVVLEIEGQAKVAATGVAQGADGSIRLLAADATIHGETARYESGHDRDNIGFWTNAKDYVAWDFAAKTAGRFRVLATYSCEKGYEGATYAVALGDQKLSGKVESTGNWSKFVETDLGELRLPGSGRFSLALRPEAMPGRAVMNLKSIVLRPVR